MTEYVVLQATEKGEWARVELAIEARSGAAAIRAHLTKDGISESVEDMGEYVAIPRRSWQPVKVQVETALKFS